MARRVNLMGVEGSVWRMDESADGPALDRGPTTAYHLYEPFDPYIHWKMNGDLVNASRGPDGVINGGTGTYAAGMVGQALFLDGVAEYVDSGSTLAIKGRSSWSWSAWVYVDASNPPISTWGRCVVAFGDGGGNAGHYMFYNSTDQRFEGSWYGDSWHSGNGSYPHSNWYHLAVAYDGTQMVITIDTAVVRTVTVSLNLQIDTIQLGLDQFGQSRYFKGGYDDVRLFYYGALDTARVTELWAGGSGTESALSDKGGGGSVAVTGMPFAYARQLTRSNGEFLETYQPVEPEDPCISAWVKFDSLPAGGARYPIVATYLSGGYGFIFEFIESGGDTVLRVGTGAGSFTYLSAAVTTEINTVDWFHVSIYIVDGQRLLFLDGQLLARDAATQLTYGDTLLTRFTVGSYYVGGSTGRTADFFDGRIAEVCIGEQRLAFDVNLIEAVSDPVAGLQPTERTIACYNFDGAGAGDDGAGNHPAVASGNVYAGLISDKTLGRSAVPGALLTIPHHADFDDPQQPLTIEGWFYIGGSGTATLVEKGDGTNITFSLAVNLLDGITAQVKDSNGVNLVTTAGLVRGALNYVAMTWDAAGQELILNVNGVLSRRRAWGVLLDLDLISNTEDVLVGSGVDGDLNGAIMSLRFNRELRPNHMLQAAIDGRRYLYP